MAGGPELTFQVGRRGPACGLRPLGGWDPLRTCRSFPGPAQPQRSHSWTALGPGGFLGLWGGIAPQPPDGSAAWTHPMLGPVLGLTPVAPTCAEARTWGAPEGAPRRGLRPGGRLASLPSWGVGASARSSRALPRPSCSSPKLHTRKDERVSLVRKWRVRD